MQRYLDPLINKLFTNQKINSTNELLKNYTKKNFIIN